MTAAINRRTMLRLLLLAFFPWMHLGCGGGGDSQAGGGIGGTGLYASSVGTVTEFGSVVVNGVTYETRNAQVIVENDLKGVGPFILAGIEMQRLLGLPTSLRPPVHLTPRVKRLASPKWAGDARQ